MENEISVLTWRVTRGIPSGVHIWFDPNVESVRLFRVPTCEQQAVGRALHLEGVARGDPEGYLDKVDSVSAPESEAEPAHSSEVNDPPDLGLEDLPF